MNSNSDVLHLNKPNEVIEVSAAEAKALGAFEETALTIDDAWDALEQLLESGKLEDEE